MCAAKFADFEEATGGERWEATVRRLGVADVARVAELLAEREERSLDAAAKTVTAWVDAPGRVVLVAEHADRVVGYGKAEWLDPAEGGGSAPTGWYLAGLVVAAEARRHGIGDRLTAERLRLLGESTEEVWYFANLRNAATIELHARFGFIEQTRDFLISGVAFEGGEGALFRLALRPADGVAPSEGGQ